MTKTSPIGTEPLGNTGTAPFVHTDLAETVERATASRFVVVRAGARAALAADARLLPVRRVVRKLVSGGRALAERNAPTTPAVVQRGLLAASATVMAAASGVGIGILPGPGMDLASGGPGLAPADATGAAHAASFHPGHGSGGLFPTTPPPGLNVATLAPPPPGAAPSTTAPSTTAPPPPADRYVNPLAQIANLQPKRIDQGVDYAGAGPLLALGSGTIRMTTEGGWPGGAFIALQLDRGLFAGQVVYYAENITPVVRVGQHVEPGDAVGILHNAFPNLEIGWGGGGRAGGTIGDALARTTGGDAEGVSSAVGVNFNQFLVFLGAPSGIQQGLMGHLP